VELDLDYTHFINPEIFINPEQAVPKICKNKTIALK
jgi:hypothetical protein